MSNCKLRWSELGLVDYDECFKLMQEFTHHRDSNSEDLILSLEHNPVITVGPTTQPLNDLDINIPVIKTNRGGKATYHGPGQWILYTLVDLRRLGITASQLVSILEETVIASLRVFGIHAYANPNARGVYIKQQKIASIGIRISKGCSYHGLSFNLDMDLSPFNAFSVCGNDHLTMTQFSHFQKCNISTIKKIGRDIFLKKLQMSTQSKISYTIENSNFEMLYKEKHHA